VQPLCRAAGAADRSLAAQGLRPKARHAQTVRLPAGEAVDRRLACGVQRGSDMELPIRKILLPTDFSEGSRGAAQVAIDLARRLGAEVTLLHAYVLPTYMFPDGAAIVPDAQQVTQVVNAVDDSLTKLARALATADVRVTTRAVDGDAAHEIVRIAREEGFGMVVMGTHGRTGLRHLLLGSVAERVVRTSAVPVLTVRLEKAAPEHVSAPVI
jgi:nucleotide-binding universal stress UspA family protein